MGELFKVAAELLVIELLGIFLIRKLLQKMPTYAVPGKRGERPERVIVYAPYVVRHGTGGYMELHYVKNKRGRFRFRPSILDWFAWIFCGGIFLALAVGLGYYWITEGMTSATEIAMLCFIYVQLVLLYCVLNISRISARVYFHRLMKGKKST